MPRIYKDQQFKVRLTKEQLTAVRAAALRDGVTPTAWAVRCLMVAAAGLDLESRLESRLRGIVLTDAQSERTGKKAAVPLSQEAVSP
jgi:hypothetical protein